jgi:hypothetical protein
VFGSTEQSATAILDAHWCCTRAQIEAAHTQEIRPFQDSGEANWVLVARPTLTELYKRRTLVNGDDGGVAEEARLSLGQI